MGRRALFLLIVAIASPAMAQDRSAGGLDYDLRNRDWNGLSDFAALARAEGYEVQTSEWIDWGDISQDDLLFFVYPMDTVDPSHVATFVRRGGHVLIADDHGKADTVLARFGIVREHGPITGARRYKNNPNLPVAVPWDEAHPLATGVGALQTNHPSTFRSSPGPEQVFGFGQGQAVVVSGSLGKGRFVALSDPSVLVNRMLAFDGNGAFALNVIRFLQHTDVEPRGRIIILTRTFALTGAPQPIDDEDRSLNEILGEVDAALDEWNDWVASVEALKALCWGGAILGVLLATFTLPWRRRREMDAGFARAREEDRQQAYHELVQHYDEAGVAASYAYPTALLRDRLDDRLGALIGAHDPLTTVPPEDLIRRVQSRAGLDAAQLLARLAPRLRRLPPRNQAHIPWPFVSRRELERIHDDALELEKILSEPAAAETPRTLQKDPAA